MDVEFRQGEPKLFSVLELLVWIKQSHEEVSFHPLTLPPMQRNGVWRPQQVLDLWRSVLDGMPIGLFYLQPAGKEIIDQADQKNLTQAPEGALNLFDGQQRIRALALGAGDPFGEKRSIWVRFVGEDYELILSSRTQPAGYKSDGSRLSIDERRKWLEAAKKAKQDDELWTLPPVGCTQENALRLAHLLRPDLPGADSSVKPVKPASASDPAWTNFLKDVENLSKQQCAIFMLLPEHVAGDPNKTLDLFRRIGAGGTPLSQPEQVYSAYKLRKPEIRVIVETIHKDISSVLTPAQIVQAALRMAHTRADKRTGWAPGFDTVMKEFSSKNTDTLWVKRLDALLLAKEGAGSLIQAFDATRKLLGGARRGNFYLPEIVMAQLPAELWQVIAFWALSGNRDQTDATQQEVVRFAMAWHLAVTNPERAAQVCFRDLVDRDGTGFPGKVLFQALIGSFAHPIPTPEALDCMFLRGGSGRWLTYKERFKEEEPHRDLASAWWFSRKMLPWLQRDYLGKQFTDYQPMSDHEDDRPYDWDHICPRADWKPDGRGIAAKDMGFDDENDRKAKMGDPGMVGDSVGNFRLVNFPQNRGDGAKRIFEKLLFLDAPDKHPELGSASDFLLGDEVEIALWRKVDTGGPVWDDNRRGAFQQVVEFRTARLYRAFHEQLGFDDSWSRGAGDPVEPVPAGPTMAQAPGQPDG